MTAVDVPPHLGLGGRAAGELGARPGPRRLARIALVYCVLAGAATVALVARQPIGQETLLTAPFMLVSITAVGYAVRRATVTISADGVRWGWPSFGVRMGLTRIVGVDLYEDAVAIRPRRGSTWFLMARDWDRFDALAQAVRTSGLPAVEHGRRAPWRARMQSYGRVLDGLMVVCMMAATAALIGAVGYG